MDDQIEAVEKERQNKLIEGYSQEEDIEVDVSKLDKKIERLKAKKNDLKNRQSSIEFVIRDLSRHHRLNEYHLQLKERKKLLLQIGKLQKEKDAYERESSKKLEEMADNLGQMRYRASKLEYAARQYIKHEGPTDFPDLFEENPTAEAVAESVRLEKGLADAHELATG